MEKSNFVRQKNLAACPSKIQALAVHSACREQKGQITNYMKLPLEEQSKKEL